MRGTTLFIVAILVAGLSGAAAYMIPSMLYSSDPAPMPVTQGNDSYTPESSDDGGGYTGGGNDSSRITRPKDFPMPKGFENFQPQMRNGQPQIPPQLEAIALIINLVFFGLGIVVLISFCVAFRKAGEGWWAVFIPFYNIFVLLRIVGKEWYWFFFLMIPCLNVFLGIYIYVLFAQSFGRGTLFGIGLALFPWLFMPIIAFSSMEYEGPAG